MGRRGHTEEEILDNVRYPAACRYGRQRRKGGCGARYCPRRLQHATVDHCGQRLEVRQQGHGSLGVSKQGLSGLHSAGTSRGKGLHRELQRTVTRRAPERRGLLHAGRCSQKARSFSRRLQSPPPAFGPGGQNAGRVCGPVQRRPPNGRKPNSSLPLPRRFDTQCAPIQLAIAHLQIVAWLPGRPLQSRNSLLYSFTVKLAFVTCVAGPQLPLTAAPLPPFTVTACVVVWAFSLHVFNVYLPGGTSLIV